MIPVQRDVVQVDNRDDRTTWLWISDTEYVEVDIPDLLENSLENNPIPDSWIQLVEWAKARNKTETDLLRWFAQSDLYGYRELDDKELIDILLEGIRYDVTYVSNLWEGLDEETQSNYQTYMIENWEIEQ